MKNKYVSVPCSLAVWFDSLYIKITITILVVVSFLLFPKVGFLPLGAEGFDIIKNIVFPFSHANIFHLLCNILCLWQMRNLKHYVIPAFIIQFLCSLIPEYLTDIMGLSGFLFAIIGLKYGYYDRGMQMVKSIAPFFIMTAFLPNVAVLYHAYCLLAAFAIGLYYNTFCLWKMTRL